MSYSILFISSTRLPIEFQTLDPDYSVTHSNSAKQTLDELKSDPSLVVIDIDNLVSDMPMDEFIKSAHSLDPFMPILLAVRSSDFYEEIIKKVVTYLKCGAQQFIQLPASKNELIWVLSDAIEQKYLARSATQYSMEKLTHPDWKEGTELFVQLIEKKREKGLPVTADEIRQFISPTQLNPATKEALIARVSEPFYEVQEKTKTFTILTIDDEVDVRKQLADVFLIYFTVLQAQNGAEGLKILSERHIDVVLLDIQMPDIHGDEMIQDIKRLSPKTEIIMVTGTADFDLISRTIHLGATDYLLKPFNRQYLKTIVCRILQRVVYREILSECIPLGNVAC